MRLTAKQVMLNRKVKLVRKRHSAPFDISIKLNYKLQQVSSVCTANLR